MSSIRIRFRPSDGDWTQTQARFDAQIDAALEKSPRLSLLARGHSHPFDTVRTHPSGPDRSEHLAPCLQFNRTLGIKAGFTFIAVRAQNEEGWALHCFAARDDGEVLDLGLAELPIEANPAFAAPPFHATENGHKLEAFIYEHFGDSLQADRLPLGWTRYRIISADRPHSVLAVPPDYPAAPGRRFVFAEGVWSSHDVLDWRAYLPLPVQKPIAQGVAP